MVAEHRDKRVAREQNTDSGTKAVRKVKHRQRNFGTTLAHKPGSDERECHTHGNRNRERGARRKNHLRDFGTDMAKACRKFAIEEEPGEQIVERMVGDTANTNRKFHGSIAEQRALHLFDKLARDKATNGKAAHVDAEREHLPVAGMAKKEFEVTGPGTFVNEASEPGERKEEINKNVHGVNLYKYALKK